MRNLPELVNRTLARVAKPRLPLFGRDWCSFHVTGAAGLVLTAATGLLLASMLNRSVAVMAAVIGVALVCLWTLLHLRRIVTGNEGLTYYHHEVVVLTANAGFLSAVGEPVLAYLDIAALSLGVLLASGRIGCFLVGCCHGRPSRCGVRYGAQTVDAGLPAHLKGVCLVPVQLMESAWVLATVAGGLAVIQTGPEGAALAWYLIVYGWGRFLFEFLRGDSNRPYWLGFSEAQWTSVVLMTSTAWMELAGVLPLTRWHLAATALMAASMAVIRAAGDPAKWLSHPRHVEQLAALVASPPVSRRPQVGNTSLGIRVSASVVDNGAARFELFAFSAAKGKLGPQHAGKVAKLTAQLRGLESGAAGFQGNGGVYHLILPAEARRHGI